MICSPEKAKKDEERLKASRRYIPIEDRLKSVKLSDKAASEVGKAGRVAVDALGDIKSRFTQGSRCRSDWMN